MGSNDSVDNNCRSWLPVSHCFVAVAELHSRTYMERRRDNAARSRTPPREAHTFQNRLLSALLSSPATPPSPAHSVASAPASAHSTDDLPTTDSLNCSLVQLWNQEPDSQDTDEERVQLREAHIARCPRLAGVVNKCGLPVVVNRSGLPETGARVVQPPRLEDVLEHAIEEHKQSNPLFRIEFMSSVLHVDDVDDDIVTASVFAVASGALRFYVGATVSPVWRWLGWDTVSGRRMHGHCEGGWDRMNVVGLRQGSAGPQLETRCINVALEHFGASCTNKARDSRGCSGLYPNFVYVVWV